MSKKYLISAPPPTPNGDLHLGHLSGPYFNADIFSRSQRLLGNITSYLCSTDDHQSFVITKAKQENRSPQVVIDDYHNKIKNTLLAANIRMDCFTKPNTSRYRERVQQFFLDLYKKGALEEIIENNLYCSECKEYLFEAHVKGKCPHCQSNSSGNYCEACGNPNDPTQLINPICTTCGKHPETKPMKKIVFPLEKYRKPLENYYSQLSKNWRPHLQQYIEQLMSKPLPDVPIINYYDWGIPVPLESYKGYVLNVWFEMLPGLFETAEVFKEQSGETEDFWNINSEFNIIQFLGFDNSFYYTVLHPALLIASGNYKLSDQFITNKFYLLDNEKFSTSRGHAIWGIDFLRKEPSDWVRYFLSLTNPENMEANFNLSNYREVVNYHQLEWHNFTEKHMEILSSYKEDMLDEEMKQLIEKYEIEFKKNYSPETFSISSSAKNIHNFINDCNNLINIKTSYKNSYYALRALCIFASPIIPNLSKRIWGWLGLKDNISWSELKSDIEEVELLRI
jgi:methionyl-tRNA synthetase